MPWYAGEPLLDLLEALPVDAADRSGAAFPGAMGRAPGRQPGRRFPRLHGPCRSGRSELGDTIVVLPANREATVAEIIAPVPGGVAQVDRAFAGQTVTIRLAEDVDVSRGDTFVLRGAQPAAGEEARSGPVLVRRKAARRATQVPAEADHEHRVRAHRCDQGSARRAYAVAGRSIATTWR